MTHRNEEWHITVEGDHREWYDYCCIIGIKPLRIELSTHEIQLMCAIPNRWAGMHTQITNRGFRIVRTKHEVQTPLEGETPLYYECHVKLDGPFDPRAPMASRDLYRDNRWYVTKRKPHPFDAFEFVQYVQRCLEYYPGVGNTIAGWEYEAALIDTNPSLDSKWVRG